ncbi:MAG: HEAT repeat domain-containing protein [Thermoanaerobaculaceae bacterium]
MRLFGPNVAKLREKKDVAGLVQALSDKDEGVRKDAVEALVFIGAGPDLLGLALRSRAWSIWVSTAKLIGAKGDTRAVPGLAAGLAVDEPSVRWTAIQSLGQMSPVAVRDIWLTALALPFEEVSSAASRALGASGSGGAEELVRALASAGPASRAGLVRAIGMAGARAAAPAVVAVLEDRTNVTEARIAAVEALGVLRNTAAVEPLIAALEEKELAPAACAALGALQDPRAVEPLIRRLADVGDTHLAAKSALQSFGAQACPALGEFLLDSDPHVRSGVTEVLRSLTWSPASTRDKARLAVSSCRWEDCVELGAEAVRPLVAALAVDGLRLSAAETLGKMADACPDLESLAVAVEPLLACLSVPCTEESRRTLIIDALGKLGDARAVQPLLPFLQSRDSWVRVSAAKALGRTGDPSTALELAKETRRPGNGLGSSGLEAIAAIASRSGAADAFEALASALAAMGLELDCGATATMLRGRLGASVEWCRSLLGCPDARLRARAAELLGGLGDDAAVQPLVTALEDEDTGVREAAARALGVLGAKEAVPALLAALHGKGIDLPVIEALAKLRDPRVIGPLLARLPENEEDALAADRVALECAEALDQLGYLPDQGPAGRAYCAVRAGHLLLSLFDKNENVGRASARRLVAWYHQGLLGPFTAQRLLERREYIRKPHEETVHANDCFSVTNTGGLGVEF